MDYVSRVHPRHIQKALQLTFTHNLDDISYILLHYNKRILKDFSCPFRDYIEETCEVSIIYDKPDNLDNLLNEMVTQIETNIDPRVKNKVFVKVCRLMQTREALQKHDLKEVVVKYFHRVKEFNPYKGYNPYKGNSLSKRKQTRIPIMLLMKHNLTLETIPTAQFVLDVSQYMNTVDNTGTCLHHFTKNMLLHWHRDPILIKKILDLGVIVDNVGQGRTILTHLIFNTKINSKYRHPREAEEWYIYQNPDIEVHKSVISYAVKADQISHK